MNQNTFDFAKPCDPTKPPALPLARKSDPETSHIAAAKVEEFEESHEAKILRVLRNLPADKTDATSAEIADELGWRREVPARRMKKLVTEGIVEVLPKRMCDSCEAMCIAYRIRKESQ